MNKADFISQKMLDNISQEDLDKCQKLAKQVIETGDAIADLYATHGLAVIYNPKKLCFEIIDM